MSNTLAPHINQAIDDHMLVAWNNADDEGLAYDSEFMDGWNDLTAAKRRHLKSMVKKIVSHLDLVGDIRIADKDRPKYKECAIADYEVGDMARVTDGEDVYEFRVTGTGFNSIGGASITARYRHGLKFERAPKPITPPDPEVHRLIVDHENSDRIYEARWDSSRLEDLYYATGSAVGVRPSLFKDWSAMKLVPTEED